MQTQTAKMIYDSEAVANMICGKMTKAKGKHIVMKVATGFQVCPVTICQGAVSPHNAKPIPKMINPFDPALETPPGVVVVELPFKAESPKYVTCWKDGKEISFGKGTLIAWEVGEAWVDGQHKPATVKLKISEALAKKRGLVA